MKSESGFFKRNTVVKVFAKGKKHWYGVVFAQTASVTVIQELQKDGSMPRHLLPICDAELIECTEYTGISGLVACLSRHSGDRLTPEMIARCRRKKDLLALCEDGYVRHVWRKLAYETVLTFCLEHHVSLTTEMIEACTNPRMLLMLARQGYLTKVWDKIPYEEALAIALAEAERAYSAEEQFSLGCSGAKGSADFMADIYKRVPAAYRPFFGMTDEELIACYKAVPDDNVTRSKLANVSAKYIDWELLQMTWDIGTRSDIYGYIYRMWTVKERMARGETLQQAFRHIASVTRYEDRKYWKDAAQAYRHELDWTFWNEEYDPGMPG